jgi:hypothetical protein
MSFGKPPDEMRRREREPLADRVHRVTRDANGSHAGAAAGVLLWSTWAPCFVRVGCDRAGGLPADGTMSRAMRECKFDANENGARGGALASLPLQQSGGTGTRNGSYSLMRCT